MRVGVGTNESDTAEYDDRQSETLGKARIRMDVSTSQEEDIVREKDPKHGHTHLIEHRIRENEFVEMCSVESDVSENQTQIQMNSEDERMNDKLNNTNYTEDEEREYWRPSYMFHWLKAIGRPINEAYVALKEYKGKTSYRELNLHKPETTFQDENDSEWSHVSDYDEFGLSPIGDAKESDESLLSSTADQRGVLSKMSQTQSIEEYHHKPIGSIEHSGYTAVMLDDHVADARDDRVGRSHVVCPNHRGVPRRRFWRSGKSAATY